MAQVETTIDSIRVGAFSPERTIILREKGPENYLPFWVSSSQADILATELQGRPDKSTAPDLFLANINAVDSDIKGVTVHLENNTFYRFVQSTSTTGGNLAYVTSADVTDGETKTTGLLEYNPGKGAFKRPSLHYCN